MQTGSCNSDMRSFSLATTNPHASVQGTQFLPLNSHCYNMSCIWYLVPFEEALQHTPHPPSTLGDLSACKLNTCS